MEKLPGLLPLKSDDLRDMVTVVIVGPHLPRPDEPWLSRQVGVHRQRMLDADNKLRTDGYNPLYCAYGRNDDAFDEYPANGEVPQSVYDTMTEVKEDEDVEISSSGAAGVNNIPEDTEQKVNPEPIPIMTSAGWYDVNAAKVTKANLIGAAIERALDPECIGPGDAKPTAVRVGRRQVLQLPHSIDPLSDYTDKEYLTLAFVHLFCRAMGGFDLTGKTRRRRPLAFKRWLRHLLRLLDDRFIKDEPFMYTGLNIMQRRQLSLHATLIMKHPSFLRTADEMKALSYSKVIGRVRLNSDSVFSTR